MDCYVLRATITAPLHGCTHVVGLLWEGTLVVGPEYNYLLMCNMPGMVMSWGQPSQTFLSEGLRVLVFNGMLLSTATFNSTNTTRDIQFLLM